VSGRKPLRVESEDANRDHRRIERIQLGEDLVRVLVEVDTHRLTMCASERLSLTEPLSMPPVYPVGRRQGLAEAHRRENLEPGDPWIKGRLPSGQRRFGQPVSQSSGHASEVGQGWCRSSAHPSERQIVAPCRRRYPRKSMFPRETLGLPRACRFLRSSAWRRGGLQSRRGLASWTGDPSAE
jgi:hypothetical protein